MMCAENPPPSNFRRPVIGCIEAKCCKKICVGTENSFTLESIFYYFFESIYYTMNILQIPLPLTYIQLGFVRRSGPNICIAVINHENFSRARDCVRTAAHLGLIRSRRRAEKKLPLDWRMAMSSFGSPSGLCTHTHAWTRVLGSPNIFSSAELRKMFKRSLSQGTRISRFKT